MAKKIEVTEDRLSDLPDSVLVHILSMLCGYTEESREVVRTSVLSKRWQFLWMSVPVSLKIEIPEDNDVDPPDKWERDAREYLNSTHRELHYWGRCQKIRKFSVVYDVPYPEKFVKDVDLWVYFASKLANVENFKLRCEGEYTFPGFAYKNSSWKKLDMELCTELNPPANMNWSGVVSLTFRFMEWTDDVMERVLSGCPNLECLKLYHFFGVHRLEISNMKTRELIIDNSGNGECDLSIEILAPYIQNLKILGSCREIYLRNVASLVTAVLDFDLEFDFSFEDEDPLPRKQSTCLKELFHSVAHVEKLELGLWCIQYLSILELEGWQPPPSSWKFLQLTSKLKQLNFCGVCSFLQSSSDLETLVIDGCDISRDLLLRYTNKVEQTKRFETHDFNCSFLDLKTIKILNFSGSVMPLVKYLLKHASVLEKFIITARRKRREEDPLPRKESTCLMELFHSVAHVEKLELGHRCIQLQSGSTCPFWNWMVGSLYHQAGNSKQLTTKLKQLNFCGICSFLQSSSYLETLVIDGYNESRSLLLRYTNKDEQTRKFETHDFNCSFLHLKTIKILNFSRSDAIGEIFAQACSGARKVHHCCHYQLQKECCVLCQIGTGAPELSKILSASFSYLFL